MRLPIFCFVVTAGCDRRNRPSQSFFARKICGAKVIRIWVVYGNVSFVTTWEPIFLLQHICLPHSLPTIS